MTLNPDVAAQLKGRRILVTNDDGIDADGLGLLERAARKYSGDARGLAPATHHSAPARGIASRPPQRRRLRVKPSALQPDRRQTNQRVTFSRPGLLVKSIACAAMK